MINYSKENIKLIRNINNSFFKSIFYSNKIKIKGQKEMLVLFWIIGKINAFSKKNDKFILPSYRLISYILSDNPELMTISHVWVYQVFKKHLSLFKAEIAYTNLIKYKKTVLKLSLLNNFVDFNNLNIFLFKNKQYINLTKLNYQTKKVNDLKSNNLFRLKSF